MKKYQILYRFKGNCAYNDHPYNEGFIQASTKKEAKEKFKELMSQAECEAKIIRIIEQN
jgi:hypothetical protein